MFFVVVVFPSEVSKFVGFCCCCVCVLVGETECLWDVHCG